MIKFNLLFFFLVHYVWIRQLGISFIRFVIRTTKKMTKKKKEAHSHKFIWDTQRKKKRNVKEYCLFSLQGIHICVFFFSLNLRCSFFSCCEHWISKKNADSFVSFGNRINVLTVEHSIWVKRINMKKEMRTDTHKQTNKKKEKMLH